MADRPNPRHAGASVKVTHVIHIFANEDPETAVRVIEVHAGSDVDRVERGLAINFDFDNYYYTVEQS